MGENSDFCWPEKGWLCKTWGAELALVTMPGAIPEKFTFTVPDNATAGRINALVGDKRGAELPATQVHPIKLLWRYGIFCGRCGQGERIQSAHRAPAQ